LLNNHPYVTQISALQSKHYRLDVKIAVVKVVSLQIQPELPHRLDPQVSENRVIWTSERRVGIILTDECKELKLEMLALEIMPDHLHLFVGAKTHTHPCVIVKQSKGVLAIRLREQFPELIYLGYPQRWKQFPHLWARGYYCGSAGMCPKMQ